MVELDTTLLAVLAVELEATLPAVPVVELEATLPAVLAVELEATLPAAVELEATLPAVLAVELEATLPAVFAVELEATLLVVAVELDGQGQLQLVLSTSSFEHMQGLYKRSHHPQAPCPDAPPTRPVWRDRPFTEISNFCARTKAGFRISYTITKWFRNQGE